VRRPIQINPAAVIATNVSRSHATLMIAPANAGCNAVLSGRRLHDVPVSALLDPHNTFGLESVAVRVQPLLDYAVTFCMAQVPQAVGARLAGSEGRRWRECERAFRTSLA
jgi:hypothetical protein